MLDKNLTFGGVFFMAKYTKEFKFKVVQYVLKEKHGVKTAKKHFGLHSHGDIVKWVNKYLEHGEKGLERNNDKYDSNFKISVVKYMQENNLSLTRTAIHFNLSGAKIVAKWLKAYEDGKLKAKEREEEIMPRKTNKDKENKDIATQKLLEENEYLRAENAYLKKLNALVQERIKRENKKKQ